MSEENKNLNTISEDTANADSNAVAETADKKEDTKAKKNKKNKSEKGRFKKFMKSRKAKHGTVAMAITALVIVMVLSDFLLTDSPTWSLTLHQTSRLHFRTIQLTMFHTLTRMLR